MTRTPHVNENGLRKGPWSKEEDDKLRAYITRYGHWNWREIPRFAGVSRCGKSCRLRWMNYLRPNIKHGNFTKTEEDLIMEIHSKIGNKWAKIAAELPGRSDNEIKNYWHTHLKKRAKINDENEVKNTNSLMGEISSDFGEQNELEALWASLSSELESPSSSVSVSVSVSSSSVELTASSSISGASDCLISSGESSIQTYSNCEIYDVGRLWADPFFADYDGMISTKYGSDLNVFDSVIMASDSWHNSNSDEFMYWSSVDLCSEYESQFMI